MWYVIYTVVYCTAVLFFWAKTILPAGGSSSFAPLQLIKDKLTICLNMRTFCALIFNLNYGNGWGQSAIQYDIVGIPFGFCMLRSTYIGFITSYHEDESFGRAWAPSTELNLLLIRQGITPWHVSFQDRLELPWLKFYSLQVTIKDESFGRA